MLRVRRWFATAVALGLGFAACTGDHDALKHKPDPGGTGGTDAGGDASDAGSGGTLPSDAAPDLFVEPVGENELTLVHGVVDAKRVAFCFAKVTDGIPGPALGQPLPAGGLHYGGALAQSALSALDWAKDDVQPIVIAAEDFSLLAGKSCAEAMALAQSYADAGTDAATDAADDVADAEATDASDAGPSDAGLVDAPVEVGPPPPVRAAALPVLPVGTLSAGYSQLLVAVGCLGAPGFVDDLADLVCGTGYSPATPTLGPVLVTLSRVTLPDKVGLQAVNASLANESVDFVSSPPQGSSLAEWQIASAVTVGAIEPRPPLLEASKLALGNPIGQSTLDVFVAGSAAVALSVSWQSAVAPAGTGEPVDGRSYAIVLLGPRVTLPVTKWWNPPGLTVVPTDP